MRIKEFLPNPVGPDRAGEYIAIENEGNVAASLDLWRLRDASGKEFVIRDVTLASRESREFPASLTKISLNNSGETITLFDPQGNVGDELGYAGAAREGWLVRRSVELTPELRAEIVEPLALTAPALDQPGTPASLLPTMALVGAAAAVLAYRITKHYEDPEHYEELE